MRGLISMGGLYADLAEALKKHVFDRLAEVKKGLQTRKRGLLLYIDTVGRR